MNEKPRIFHRPIETIFLADGALWFYVNEVDENWTIREFRNNGLTCARMDCANEEIKIGEQYSKDLNADIHRLFAFT